MSVGLTFLASLVGDAYAWPDEKFVDYTANKSSTTTPPPVVESDSTYSPASPATAKSTNKTGIRYNWIPGCIADPKRPGGYVSLHVDSPGKI